MRVFLEHADHVLRGMRPAVERANTMRELARLLSIIVVFGMVYGAVMGAYGGITPDRYPQIIYSAIKVPILLLFTFALSVPAFFVINSLLGLRNDFAESVRSLISAQAGLTIVLASFAPITVIWYLSVDQYSAAILFNALMFGTASISAQIILSKLYRPLIARNPMHRRALYGWLILYGFVGIQMGWMLRPFVGAPGQPTTFFRESAWGNAYVEVFRNILDLFGR